MSKNYLIDGEIYLKKEPEKIDITGLEEEYKNLKECINQIKDEEEKGGFIIELQNIIKDINYYKEMNYLEYETINTFYQLNTNGLKFNIINTTDKDQYTEYIDKEKMERDYRSLIDFLERAKFIGRKFYRTKSIISASIDEAIEYMEDNDYENNEITEYIVLYASENLFLVKRIYKNGEKYFTNYEIADERYIKDNNYKFYGKIHNEYKDKYSLYIDILKEITEYQKPKGYTLD